ncbi:ShlB/FhaC/HecB family hemolysin secretion/activation protein [Cronobacter dublinensis]|uniref:ShlB/FhaC/HecB family hemolysin secretion/activation protein n=1 Tax=Cronobacter dublinensis TaxID=413497 RepID=UPI000CFBB539|nr:ShlB/FhaC/HecB family hemolysin secretion/activation protein [Cronobacter dublinensis]ELY6212100.1 ShlB/FhaC/HecB family hemolysin secretion/activation protein [Cronobacter dublinensis]EMD9245825.1 ShlB/FhaC/HecB family hemolysin secretion/activation protein [Cronobacter dublinensis]MDI6445149.1 ShlB/FhaC/HecB family hemolysin secretion/activation protein [Cronobacter dublinensis]
MQGKALPGRGLILLLATLPVPLIAAPGDPSLLPKAEEQFQHQQQQQKAREARLAAEAPDIRIPVATASSSQLQFPDENPCFTIERVTLAGKDALPHWVPLQRLADQAVGHCLGVQGINMIIGTLQDRIIEHGWVTTRVLAPQQDLREGELTLRIVPGRIRDVALTSDSGRYIRLWPTMPAHAGNLLDLRDIEQGLENMQRLPTVQARMELQPGDAPGESDIVIQRVQSRFWRVGAWVDDTGTESTGRYQGGVMLALDNPASLSDLFYVTASRDLGFAGRKSSKNISGHYSVPFGYWTLGLTASDYQYSQTIAGRNADILYAGKSHSLDVQLSRVLHRGAASKTSVTWDVLMREARNYIEDVEVENQRRRTSAWRLGLEHRHYLGPATLDASVSYQRGTRWFGAQPAWEEDVDDETYATALSKIVTWKASLTMPFTLWSQDFNWTTQYDRQMSDTPLTPQEEFSIGNRWTVRGFDGERTLSASRGWTLQNTLGWSTPLPAQELYLGADYGEVGGNSSTHAELSGQHLAGGVLGVRGAIERAHLSYDLFSGVPFSKPPGFKTDPVTFGFSLNWNY